MSKSRKVRKKAVTLVCKTCGKKGAIRPGVPWGKTECRECRERTGNCLICGQNRNDCCC